MNVRAWKGNDKKQIRVDGKLSWRLRWETKDPGTGKRQNVYETFHGSKREAERRWVEREGEIRQEGAGFIKPAKMTVGQYMEKWIHDYCEVNLKPTTVASYRSIAEGHIIPGIGAVPLADLAAPQVSSWLADVARKSGRSGERLSPRRVAYVRAVLRDALHEAVRQRLIHTNPVDLVRAPRQDPKQVEAFTLQEVQALDKAAAGQRLEALIRISWRTGLRLGELLGLHWDAVDLDGRTITVRSSLVEADGKRIMQESAKTKRGTRTIAMTDSVASALRAHRAAQAAERLAAGWRWQDNDLVFATRAGKPLAPRNVQRLFYLLRDRAGLPDHGVHALRHTYATLAKRAGVPIEDISDALGHESPAFTAKVYAHVLPEGRRDNADRFEAYTRTAKGG